jgi:hypothetical protein
MRNFLAAPTNRRWGTPRSGEAVPWSEGRRTAPAILGNTIVTLPEVPLRPLCVEESDTQTSAGQRLFKIRLADGDGQRTSSALLVKRRYAWRGYCVGNTERIQPNRLTLSACNAESVVVATISVGLDSSAGLFVDHLYAKEIDAVRAAGRKVCEFTRLAVEASVRSKPVLAALFHIAYIYARRISRCADLFVEVNPRHVAFYRQMLDFAEHAAERIDPRIGAPAMLLRLDLATAERQIAAMGGRLDLARARRSLYPYFFASDEEHQIERRLRTVG